MVTRFLLVREHVSGRNPCPHGCLLLIDSEFLDGIIHHPPVYESYTTPVYSNLAYAILGLAYENITGQSIFDGQRDVFINKLGMTSTTPTAPGAGADAIIPRNDSYAIFSYDIGIQGP
jgi:CubicO group peptidase (beta-lactamase class C family)